MWVARTFFAASILIVLREIFRGTAWVRFLSMVFSSLVFPVDEGGLGVAVLLGIIGAALLRRKRVAWSLALVWLGLWWLVSVFMWVVFLGRWLHDTDLSDRFDHLLIGYLFNFFSTGALALALWRARNRFTARLTPGNLKKAVLTLVGGLVVSGVVATMLSVLVGHGARPRSRVLSIFDHVVFGDEATRPVLAPGWVQLVVGLLVAASLLTALVVLMRSQRSHAYLPLNQELAVRELLEQNPEDSLGYFNTRRDKQVVFAANGQAAIAYRVELGACLASGDPVGRTDHWPAAIDAYLALARQYGWTPGVVGASEEGARAYQAAGLRAMRVGDEAILQPERFDLDSRELKNVRTAVSRLRKQGYLAQVRRHKDIPADELACLITLADSWRDGDDRGFSMALNRMGDALDGDCLLVQAMFPEGEGGPQQRVAGILSFVPWGRDGLSLDVMRRNPGAGNGITEFMVASLMAAGREQGIGRVSLNFAVFRSAIEEGERVGATMLQRFERSLVLVASRWFQIEQLYRSNVKYAPSWQPRLLCYEDASDLGQVGAAMGIAEGQIDMPGWAVKLFAPQPEPQRLVDPADPRVVAFLERQPELDVAPVRLPEQVQVRMATRQRLLDKGIEPYPVLTGVDAHCSQVASPVQGQPEVITVAGRILGVSDHGGVVFCRIQDWSGGTQVLLDAAALGRGELRRFDAVTSLGDQVSFTGTVGASRTGTPSLLVTGWKLVSKCLHPLPDKHHGISDPEALVRQRYLDLIVNRASRDRLRIRSTAIQAVRQTMLDHRYLEVETPILQTIHGGANARPFRTHINAYDLDLYLRIAPELYLKRLMVGGVDRCFEIGRNFRNEGADATHNPEFTVIEAYEANGTYHTMARLTEQMVRNAALASIGTTVVRGPGADGRQHEVDLAEPWRWTTVHDAISEGLGEQVTPDTTRDELTRHCARLGIELDPRQNRGQVLDELYDVLCEKPTIAPTFFCDFPAETSPLTRPNRHDPRLAERWDLVVFGSELGTAYSELVDPVIQRQRLTAQSLQAAGGDAEAMELDEDFLTALEYGAPPMGGLGIGLDRLVMLLTDASIRETITFPLVRPQK